MNNPGMFSVLDVTSKDVTFITSLDLVLVNDKTAYERALSFLNTTNTLAFDTETTGLSYLFDKIVGFSFGTSEVGFYVPLRHKFGDNASQEWALNLLDILKDKNLVYHNSKFDWKMVKSLYNIDLNIHGDTYIIAALLDSDRIEAKGRLGLKSLTTEYFNVDMLELEKDLGTNDFSIVPVEDALYYAATDSVCTFMLYEKLYPEISNLKLDFIYNLEISIIKHISEMEINGVEIDLDFMRTALPKLREEVKTLKSEIEEYGDYVYSIDSPKQLSELLYEKLNIRKVGESTSTDVRILKQLEDDHEIIPKLIVYSSLSTLEKSFFGKIEESIAEDGRLHSEFNQMGARSGRFSSSGGIGRYGVPINVNLQNIPKDHNGFNMRDAFITKPDYYWVHADYSQLEYRTMASLSDEDYLIESFLKGVDFHVNAASLFLGVDIENVTKEQRSDGKTLNFAVSYGMSEYGLAKRLNISVDKARDMINSYFSKLSKLQKLIQKIKNDTYNNGFVRTYFGRIRHFRNLPTDRKELEYRLRSTFNSYIQGTAADIAKMGVRKCFDAIKKEKLDIRGILQVHDEINFEVHKSIPPYKAAKFIKDNMSINIQDKNVRWVPFIADVSIGNNWGFQIEMEDFLDNPEYENVLFDDFFKDNYSEIKVKKEESSHEIEKPAIVLTGTISEKRLSQLRELIIKNPGNYNVYLKQENESYLLSDSYRINPIPSVYNTLLSIGFNHDTYVDITAETLDIEALIN